MPLGQEHKALTIEVMESELARSVCHQYFYSRYSRYRIANLAGN